MVSRGGGQFDIIGERKQNNAVETRLSRTNSVVQSFFFSFRVCVCKMKKMQINDKNRLEPSVLLFGMYQKKRQCVQQHTHLHAALGDINEFEQNAIICFFSIPEYTQTTCVVVVVPLQSAILSVGVYIEEKQEKHAQLKRHTLERESAKKSLFHSAKK